MAITFEKLKSYMPAIGLARFDATPDGDNNGRILAGFTFGTDETDYSTVNAGVLVSLQENGEYVQIRIFKLIEAEVKVLDSKYLKEFSLYLMKANYTSKIGRWCLDSDDGDCYIDWAIGVEDNDKLTENQLKRVMMGLVSSVRGAYAPMHRILITGNANPPKPREDLIKDILSKLVDIERFDLMSPTKAMKDTAKLLEIIELLDANNVAGVESILKSQ